MKKLSEDDLKALSMETHRLAHGVVAMKEAHEEKVKADKIYLDIVTKNSETVLLAEQNIQDIMKEVNDVY
ncbi:hypothetical protein LCGC14_1759070 [marine sediment metagenome]|uniref:Uncharacterized protein n=1 Tax=marine sediment metagenome TaxID=412755 RepID=A0A0F9JGP8_9ZZZZ